MIPIEAPPIRLELFLQQTYDDTEYFRARKPDGTHYASVDCASGLHAHCGFDDQGDVDEPLMAMADGTLYFIDKGPAFGIQSALVPTGTDYAWFYAHQARRTVKDGAAVKAGQQTGVMGTSGGVERHLHKSALQPKERGCWLNPGPALRAFKAQLLKPPEAKMILVKKTTVSTVYRYDGDSLHELNAHKALKAQQLGAVLKTLPPNDDVFTLPVK